MKMFIKSAIFFLALVAVSACQPAAHHPKNSKKGTQRAPATEIALLMPLSGNQAAEGRQYTGLIKMGLADGAKTPVRVTSYDAADEAKLKDSIKKILEKGTSIIIGPISSNDTKIVASQIRGRNNIAVLSFSNDPTLADKNIFIFGHAPVKQTRTLTDYLINNGYKNYITLFPAGRSSQITAKIVQDMIVAKEATLSKMEFYQNNDESIDAAVKAVAKTVDDLNEQDDNLKQPVIILGDDSENLKKIYISAQKFGLDKKAVIAGDNRLANNYSREFDIIYTASRKIYDENIKQRALAIGVDHLSYMHALMYDAGKIAGAHITPQFSVERFLKGLGESAAKFAGLSGTVHFTDSIAQREYEIVGEHAGKYRVQDQHPKEPAQEEAISSVLEEEEKS